MPETNSVSAGAKSGADKLQQSRFMKALRREKVDVTPIWLMRQAGRYQPEFREIRSRVGFLELCKNPDLACEVTLLPIEQFKVDAAIIFADILLPLEPLGVGLEYVKGEGPLIHRPLRLFRDVEALKPVDIEADLGYVLKAISLTRHELPGDVPLLGFAGSPFTMASYMIEGGSSKSYDRTKGFMMNEPKGWTLLMETLCTVTAAYLNAQIQAGAQAVQLFDSWVGCLSPADYARFVAPHMKRLISMIEGAPIINFGTGTAGMLKQFGETGGDVVGIDWRMDLKAAWETIGHNHGIQGNLDPMVLFADKPEIARQADRVLDEAEGRPGHIFNLGHGVLQQTNPSHVAFLVDHVHSRTLD